VLWDDRAADEFFDNCSKSRLVSPRLRTGRGPSTVTVTLGASRVSEAICCMENSPLFRTLIRSHSWLVNKGRSRYWGSKGFPAPSVALPLYLALQCCLKAFYCMADGRIKICVRFHYDDLSRAHELSRKETEFFPATGGAILLGQTKLHSPDMCRMPSQFESQAPFNVGAQRIDHVHLIHANIKIHLESLLPGFWPAHVLVHAAHAFWSVCSAHFFNALRK
jgi:hypothetical protein